MPLSYDTKEQSMLRSERASDMSELSEPIFEVIKGVMDGDIQAPRHPFYTDFGLVVSVYGIIFCESIIISPDLPVQNGLPRT